MPDPNLTILYVDNPTASVAFYADLLGRQPIASSPNFAMFALDNGLMLGLWSRHTVTPTATAAGSSSELAFKAADAEAVRSTHANWKRRGFTIIQAPTDLDFGHTFVAVDRDGHRLRVFAPAAP